MRARRSEIVGAVLAGGGSRRMGRDKALLPYRGRSLAGHAAERLGRVVSTVVVAAGQPRELGTGGLPQLPDHFPGLGPLAGVHSALRFAGNRPVLALACDLPLVTTELLEGLVERAPGAGSSWADEGAWVTVAAAGERIQPLCGVYGAGCLPILEVALEQRQLKVGEVLRRLEVITFSVPDLPGLPAGRQLCNVNRRRDFEGLPQAPEGTPV